ncbi:LOW QUALITY PROTEIN: uncharacterized protein LOC108046580 [Drosophila rhopaloa]|uniref:Uncharacterized protein n=1 Tax=Drosophila rhopaloa TaxID=1041015 RepID=A0ABM5J762_DRORH|nr:LOW QUALITY PROTEIN: uncharacterized protein LOC108046580 [Drosophila rhopaloa]
MAPFGATSQKKTSRVATKITTTAGRARTGSRLLQSNDSASMPAGRIKRKRPTTVVKRAAAGALTSLTGPLAGPLGLGLVNGTDRDGFPHQIAAEKAQSATRKAVPPPPPRPPRRAGAAAAASAAAGASADAYFAAKVPGAPVVGAVSHSGSSTLTLPSSAIKSSLANRRVGGGKIPDQIKHRVKFSANVHTFPSVTSTKKSARIGELQLKKKVKKLKRNRPRREGGSGASGTESSAASNQDIYKHGTIVDVESLKAPAPAQPRILRLNVVGKSSPATGQSALAAALRRQANRSLLANQVVGQEKTKKLAAAGSRTKKAKTKASGKTGGGSSTQTVLGSSSPSVERSAGLTGRKKPTATKTTAGTQRIGKTQPLYGRRVYGKV